MKKKLVGFRTIKFTCVNCKRHYITSPMMQGLDKGDECPQCGSTSFNTQGGRIVGKKSWQWKDTYDLYNSIKNEVPKEFLGAIYK